MQRTEQQPLKIGTQNLDSAVILAPMTGVTDLPFRRLAHDLGAGMVVSEMVAGDELARQKLESLRKTSGRELKPFCIQLIGSVPHWMAEGARMAESLGADIIDINMGCPAREVTGKQSGSALMRDLDHAEALIAAVVGAVSVPVTLKMRLGWDREEPQRGGVGAPRRGRRRQAHHRPWPHALPVLQGRSRLGHGAPGRGGRRIPVIVNGDIVDRATPTAALHASGAAGVMVGRGAYGAPWMPGRIAAALALRPRSGRAGMARRAGAIADEHVEAMLIHYGRALGLKNARKHVGWYLAIERPPGRDRQGLAPAAVHRGRRRARSWPDCVNSTASSGGRLMKPRKPQNCNNRSRAAAATASPARAGPAAAPIRLPSRPPHSRARSAARRAAASDARAGGRQPRPLCQRRRGSLLLDSAHGMLKRRRASTISSPSAARLLALVEQVRRSGATVNEYGVEVDLPRSSRAPSWSTSTPALCPSSRASSC